MEQGTLDDDPMMIQIRKLKQVKNFALEKSQNINGQRTSSLYQYFAGKLMLDLKSYKV